MSKVPPEVTAAAERLLDVHPVVQPTTMPKVFQEICANHNERTKILKQPSTTPADWRRMQELRKDLKQNLIPSAEKALSWNQDKGQNR